LAENFKLINDVSLNLRADTLIFLPARKHGKKTIDEGMEAILPFLSRAEVDSDAAVCVQVRHWRQCIYPPFMVGGTSR
jgi:hypothetical protein